MVTLTGYIDDKYEPSFTCNPCWYRQVSAWDKIHPSGCNSCPREPGDLGRRASPDLYENKRVVIQQKYTPTLFFNTKNGPYYRQTVLPTSHMYPDGTNSSYEAVKQVSLLPANWHQTKLTHHPPPPLWHTYPTLTMSIKTIPFSLTVQRSSAH